ncbi:hypothetical protein [Mycobacterium sp. MUNTM1]
MYARSTTIEARPSAIDTGIAFVRTTVVPALQHMDGCIGLSLLVDRRTGRCIATSSWETDKAMHASGEQVLPLQHRAAEVFGGSVAVDRWEIAFLHRDHRADAGACVRAIWFTAQPAQFDRVIQFYRESGLHAMEAFSGFCSTSLMIDRVSYRGVSSSTFQSLGAMQRSRDQAGSLMGGELHDLGADQHDVGEFDLAIAGLRVPEVV